jgi:hypothetical protein
VRHVVLGVRIYRFAPARHQIYQRGETRLGSHKTFKQVQLAVTIHLLPLYISVLSAKHRSLIRSSLIAEFYADLEHAPNQATPNAFVKDIPKKKKKKTDTILL